MDEKWDIDIKSKKSAPKKGRRAGLSFPFSLSPRDDDRSTPQDVSTPSKDSMPPSAPPRTRRSGGWADESKSEKKRSASLLEQEQMDSRSKDSDDDIPVIPNLDDYVDEELASQIAKAPLIGVNRVATYKELESDLLKHAAFASLEEVNLRILTKYLYPESALQEPDEPWSRESLFAEVVAGMNEEKQSEVTS